MADVEPREGWRSWWNDVTEYLRILSIPMIVYGICWLMRYIHMNEIFPKLVEYLDEGATVLILTAFLFASVRKAWAKV
jgi:hypothetical protein